MKRMSPLLAAVAAFATAMAVGACGQNPTNFANPTVRGTGSSIQGDQAATRDAQIR